MVDKKKSDMDSVVAKGTKEASKKDSSTAPAGSSAAPANPAAPAKPGSMKKVLMGLGTLLVLALIGVGGYFGMNYLNTPERVRAQVVPAHEVYTDLHKSMEDVYEFLLEEDESSSIDAMERELKDAREDLDEATAQRDEMVRLMDEMRVSQAEGYRAALQSYLDSANAALSLNEENIKVGEAVLEPLKEIEDIRSEIEKLSQYIYDDPNRYVSGLKDSIDELDAQVDALNAVDVSDDFDKLYKAMVRMQVVEVEFYRDLSNAVDSRSLSGLSEAQSTFSDEFKDASEEYERLYDEFVKMVEDDQDAAEDLYDEVMEAYDDLKAEYEL